MLATQVTKSKTLDTGSPAKVDANRCYEYKLKILGGWNNITLGMGLSGSRILSNDLLKSKGKLTLMTRQNYPKNKLHDAQQASRNFIRLLFEIILTKALGVVLEAGLPWHRKDVQFDKHIFFYFQGKQQMQVTRLVCLTVVQYSNCKSPDDICYPYHHLSPSGCPSICQNIYFNSSWKNTKKWENINSNSILHRLHWKFILWHSESIIDTYMYCLHV